MFASPVPPSAPDPVVAVLRDEHRRLDDLLRLAESGALSAAQLQDSLKSLERALRRVRYAS